MNEALEKPTLPSRPIPIWLGGTTPPALERAARVALPVPLLQKRGLQLVAREAGNFELTAHPGLIIKDSYWPWPQRNLAGNTIDFFVQVLGLTFHNAMREITAA